MTVTMKQPQVNSRYFTERAGILAFARTINDLRFVWRETANADVGVDGQVEHTDDEGNCKGHVIAVQVKAGPSYLSKGDEENIHFYPEEKHRNYWRNFPVPVIVAIVDTENQTTYWTDARRYLRSPSTSGEKAIRIPKVQVLNEKTKHQLFEFYGPIGDKLLSLEELLQAFVAHRSEEPTFKLSYFELFALGIIDGGTKLFFSMSVCMEIVERQEAQLGVGVLCGAAEHRFIDEYIDFLVAQNLIYYDYSDYIIDRDERRLQPIFLCPLTQRGRELLDLIYKWEGDKHVIHESFLSLADPFELSFRLTEIGKIEERIREGQTSA